MGSARWKGEIFPEAEIRAFLSATGIFATEPEYSLARGPRAHTSPTVGNERPPMNKHAQVDAPADLSDRALFELELRIARRADALAGAELAQPDRDLECWIRAEREVLSEY